MISRIAVSRLQPFPTILRYSQVRSYVFAGVFTAAAVAVPWLFHRFHLAGPTFLPMHIFVFAAALLFGWRLGVTVGLLTPVISFALSGMPRLEMLPQTVVEIAVYGAVAGILREKFSLRVCWSLLGAMVAGRLALGLAAAVVYLVVGQAYSPAGLQSGPAQVVWAATRQGLPGIAIQLVLIPLAIWLASRATESKARHRADGDGKPAV